MARRYLALAFLIATACSTTRSPLRHPPEASGFLDDYSILRPGGPGQVAFVYRNPDARWTSYNKVWLDPVTLWRSGKHSLDVVPEGDLLRLITSLESAVRRRLSQDFPLVDIAGPGVMRIRLGITSARATDPVLDVLRAHAGGAITTGDGPLHPETRRFLETAHIEGDIRDAATEMLLAAGVDRRGDGRPPLTTWAEVDRALDSWAARLCDRLEARTKGEAK